MPTAYIRQQAQAGLYLDATASTGRTRLEDAVLNSDLVVTRILRITIPTASTVLYHLLGASTLPVGLKAVTLFPYASTPLVHINPSTVASSASPAWSSSGAAMRATYGFVYGARVIAQAAIHASLFVHEAR
jgi:hypothetical protein